MTNASERLLGLKTPDIMKQAEDIILGQLRQVIASMKIEEINQDRQAFLNKVNGAVSGELEDRVACDVYCNTIAACRSA